MGTDLPSHCKSIAKLPSRVRYGTTPTKTTPENVCNMKTEEMSTETRKVNMKIHTDIVHNRTATGCPTLATPLSLSLEWEPQMPRNSHKPRTRISHSHSFASGYNPPHPTIPPPHRTPKRTNSTLAPHPRRSRPSTLSGVLTPEVCFPPSHHASPAQHLRHHHSHARLLHPPRPLRHDGRAPLRSR
jgi:hypothetical protein